MMKNLLFIAFLTIVSISLFSQTDILPPILDKPTNGDDDQVPDVELDWYAVNGIGQVSYIVEIDSSDQFDPGSPSYRAYTITTPAKNAEDLLFGVEYFWRVKAFDETSDTSAWSEVYNFTVFNEVKLFSPKEAGVIGVDPNGNVVWLATVKASGNGGPSGPIITGITFYDVEVSLEDNFNSVYFETSVPIDAYPDDTSYFFTPTQNLLFDTVYYWRVRARHDADISPWSEVWLFNTTDGVMLSSPANIEIVDEKSYNESFQCFKGYGSYYISKSLESINENIDTIDFVMRAKDKLNNNVHFKAMDATGNAFCLVYFGASGKIMAYNGDVATELMSYNGGSTANNWYYLKVVLDLDANNYDVYVDDNLKADDFSFYENASGLPKEFVWYNDETAENIIGWIDTISIYSNLEVYFTEDFETGNLIENNWSIEVPQAQDPELTLNWQPITGIDDYVYQVCKDPEFTFPCLTNFTDNNFALVPSLEFGSTYYYRVKAYHSMDTSVWSVTSKFDVTNTVILSSPEDGASGISTLPTLVWEWIRGIDEYEVRWWDEDLTYSDTAFVPGIYTGVILFKPLEVGKDYFWKVRAIKNGDTTNWSEEWHFHVGSQGLESSILNGTNVSIYPNPSNGQLSIEFNSNIQSEVQLTILDLIGKVVKENTIILHPGVNTKSFNFNDLNKGVYILRLQSGEDAYSEKLIIR